jgi:hypothetical protein
MYVRKHSANKIICDPWRPVLFKTVSLQGGDIDAICGGKFHITIFTPILMKILTDVEWQRRARMPY